MCIHGLIGGVSLICRHNGQDKRKHRDENDVRIRQVSWNSPEPTQTVEICNGYFVATQCKVHV